MAMETMKREEILQKAEKKGRMALVDPVPDPTEDGIRAWRENVKDYFRGICDDLIAESHAPEMKKEILDGLQKGFESVMRKQPESDVPIETAIRER
jgi:hypothetical protein